MAISAEQKKRAAELQALIPAEIRESKNERALAEWLSTQPIEFQQEYVGSIRHSGDGNNKGADHLQALIEEQRSEAFKRGEIRPGVNDAGQGTSLDDSGRSNAIAARGLGGVYEAAGGVSQDVGDYTVNPTLDSGPGYELGDRLTMFDDALPLDQQLQLEAIRQQRSDTTGLDAQRRALSGIEGALGAGGLSAIDRARIQESSQIRQSQARGAQEAIRANAAEQGRAGGRMQFLLEQQAQQSALGNRARDDLQTQALALGRMDTLRGQQANIGAGIQTSQDLIDKFNTEDQRAMRNAGNDARTATWDENNRRDSANIGAKNHAAGVTFATDTARSSANTDRTNTAEQINKGPSGGARGLFRDKLAAAEAAAGHGEVASGMLSSRFEGAQNREAAQEAAIIGAVGGAVGTGADIATAGITEAIKSRKRGEA